MEWWILALISALFSAFAAIIEKKILFREKVIEFTFVLAVFNAVIASLFLFFTDFTKITALSLSILFIKSILNAFAFLFVMYAIKDLELSSALPLLVLTPGIVAIFAFILFGEKLSLLNLIGLVALTSGVYILNIKDHQRVVDPFTIFFKSSGYRFVSIALLLFTTTSLIDRFLLTRLILPSQAMMAFQHLFFGIFFLILLLVARPNFNEIKKSLRNTIKISGISILILSLFTMVYRYTEILSIKGTKSVALSLILKRISVFFAVIIGGTIFNESNIMRKTVATLVLIVGAVLVVI